MKKGYGEPLHYPLLPARPMIFQSNVLRFVCAPRFVIICFYNVFVASGRAGIATLTCIHKFCRISSFATKHEIQNNLTYIFWSLNRWSKYLSERFQKMQLLGVVSLQNTRQHIMQALLTSCRKKDTKLFLSLQRSLGYQNKIIFSKLFSCGIMLFAWSWI